MSDIIFSCVIPASPKDASSTKLKELIDSIRFQDFPQEYVEIIIITEGDSESAKAMGIRKAEGQICAMFCADNYITEKDLFSRVYEAINTGYSAVFPSKYAYVSTDNSLNRYFSLIGGNDPVCYYLGKNDRDPYEESLARTASYPPSYGCNGFFYRSDLIKETDLDNYYPMDNAMEVKGHFLALDSSGIWHRTSDNLLTFLKKRYKYAKELYCDRKNRRWKMVDGREDYWRLFLFAFFVVTVIEPITVSIQGFRRVRDWAWFWHYPVCLGFLITYGLLTCRNILLLALSSRHTSVRSLLKDAFSPSGIKHIRTMK